MRVRRSTFLIATLVAATMSLAGAGAALADSGSGDTSTKPPVDTSTKTPVDTSTKPPVDTSTKPPVDTSTKPPVTTTAPPVTETPAPVTEAPKTSVPTCADTSTCVADTPKVPEVPNEPSCADRPNAADCVPKTPVLERIPEAPGGGNAQLPFTGPGDVVLAIVLALLAGSGGILFLFGASGREQLDTLNRRGMDSPSGFHLAYRELRKDQLDR